MEPVDPTPDLPRDDPTDAVAHADAPAPTTATAPGSDAAMVEPRERLEPRVIVYWILTDLFSSLLLSALLLFVASPLLPERLGEFRAAADLALWIVAGTLVAVAILGAPLAWQRWRFGFVGELLLMRYGILFVEERAVPVRRMQHVDLSRGPIERLFGLATLVVSTAGNEGSAFRVPGLSRQRAQDLRDRIVLARGHDFL